MGLARYLNFAMWWPRETLWRLSPEYRAEPPISFPLDPLKIKGLEIHWPIACEEPSTARYVVDIASGLKRFVPVQRAEIPQSSGVVMIQARYRGKMFPIAIDYSDYKDRINDDCLKRSALYFKMQYRRQGYERDDTGTKKIVPGGYVNGHPDIYYFLPHIRAAGARRAGRYDVYGRFALDFAVDIRRKAVELLRAQSDFNYIGGVKKVRYSHYLLEAAQSKICIDLPSNSDFCFRLVDYLAVGSCVIGPRHGTTMHVGMEDRKHLVYTKDDLSDLVPLCNYYLEHDEEREEIRRNARDYFDRYLHREQLAACYLRQFLTHVEENERKP